MDFSDALSMLKNGSVRSIQRSGWNGKDQYVQVQLPDEGSKMTVPYLYLINASGKYVPWVPSQGDLFAEDWVAIK
jgi:hypothetical protein